MREGRRAFLATLGVLVASNQSGCLVSSDTLPRISNREFVERYVSTLSIPKDPAEVRRWESLRNSNPPIRKKELSPEDKTEAERRLVQVLNDLNRSSNIPFKDAFDFLVGHRNKDISIGVYNNLSSVLETTDEYQMVTLPIYSENSLDIHVGIDAKHILEMDPLLLATEIVHEVVHAKEYLGFLSTFDPSLTLFEKFVKLKGIEKNDEIRFEGELIAYKIQAQSYIHAIAQGYNVPSRFDDELAATLIRASGDVRNAEFVNLIKKLLPDSKIY